jgi:ATPase subunit of ABC transporter with duplicated ATPase domains
VLLDALGAYGGTIVIVAHDRYILDKLPTHIVEVGTGKAVLYHGNYEDYVQQKARAEALAAATAARKAKR